MKDKKELWFDARELEDQELSVLIPAVTNANFNAIMFNPEQTEWINTISSHIKLLFMINEKNEESVKSTYDSLFDKRNIIVFAENHKLISKHTFENKGIFVKVNDKDSMEKSIELSNQFEDVIISFESATNIPLELILAFSQKNKSNICKVVNSADDGWIATMTMEVGSYSVLLKTTDVNHIVNLEKKVRVTTAQKNNSELKELEITSVKHIGMGDRVCIDTVSNLEKDEGMIIGSTSNGGLLISSETHYLPYMELRPFRVNAGAIHSYVWCPDDRTRYLSELKAGEEVLVFNSKGESRVVAVGRVKIEKRPLLLIEATYDNKSLNTIIQDDWHIRVIVPGGTVENSTELKVGSKVLGLITHPGRHLGVAIDETIEEK